MKISIYGDSFADVIVKNNSFTDHNNVGWPDILSKSHEVLNYARGGTSTYYSYKKFIDTFNIDNSDRIIFVITDARRWTHLLHNPKVESPHRDNLHAIPTPVMCDYWRNHPTLKHSIPDSFSDKLDAIDSYFMNLKDDTFDEIICGLMLEDVQRKRPDTIFVTGGTFHQYNPIVNPDISIAKFALSWVKNWPNYERKIVGFLPWEERRTVCHLAKEVNEVVAVEMLKAIDSGVWNPNIPEYIEASNKDFSYYYNVGGFNWQRNKS